MIAARVPGLGATRPPHHGAWSTGTEDSTGRRRCFHIPGLLVVPCARSLQQERQGRTSEAQPRSNERTFVNAWLKSPTARAASPLRRPTPSGCRSPEPREGSIRQGTSTPTTPPLPVLLLQHLLWHKNSRSREARTEETAFSACETSDFFPDLGRLRTICIRFYLRPVWLRTAPVR
jgi:hypothetical protein